jgi:predicted nucleic-acid-binding protein
MIGIDTNVLVRVIVADDPKQAAVARDFIRDRCTPDDPGFVSNIVLAELAWILAQSYGYSRIEIADAIERIMETAQLQVESPADVASALADYRAGPAGFSDCLIGHINHTAECSHTVTFDRKAAKLPGFKLLTSA